VLSPSFSPVDLIQTHRENALYRKEKGSTTGSFGPKPLKLKSWLGGLETNFRVKSSLKTWVSQKFRSRRFASEVPLGTFGLAYISGV